MSILKPKPFDFNVSAQDAAEVNAWLSALFAAGALDSADIVGGGKVSAVEFAKTRAAALLTRGSGETPLDTLQELVQGKLAEAVEQGSSLAQFEASLRETLAEDSPARAALIARTESAGAYNAGAIANYQEQGVSRVEAADGGSADSCDECNARNGQIFTVEEAADIEDHPNGTLAWIPVLDGLDESEEE
jgi:SPP1 gp7 family putative phage head morphogenesis protein